MKILLIGNFGDKNLGDELILDAAIEEFGEKNVVVMTADSDFSQIFCEKSFETMKPFPTGFRSFFRFVFSKKYRQDLFKYKNKIEKIVFVGGGLFAIKTKAYFIWWMSSLWTKKVFKGIPIYWEYQGIDQPKNFLEKWFLTSALKNAKNISVRDENSQKVLKNLGISSEKKEDRVFEKFKNLKVQKFKSEEILLLNAVKKINQNVWLDVQELAKKGNLEIVFVAFTPQDRQTIPFDFAGKVIFPKTKTELITLFNSARIVVGERFHSLVFGQKFCNKNTFLLREPYSRKVKSFCDKYKIGKI